MKLKLDENLGKGPSDIFINAGHDVVTVAGQHMGDWGTFSTNYTIYF